MMIVILYHVACTEIHFLLIEKAILRKPPYCPNNVDYL